MTALGEQGGRVAKAISCLEQSIKTDPTSSKSWYFLGRCFSVINNAKDALSSYRYSIVRNEADADTWCAMG